MLSLLAGRGCAITPTLAIITASLNRRRARGDTASESMTTAAAHAALVRDAVDAGVTVLAGTDSRPHGQIAQEVRALAGAGISTHAALGAASWDARTYLGLPGLVDGAPADAVIYPQDPRTDLRALDHPTAVILRGRHQTTRRVGGR